MDEHQPSDLFLLLHSKHSEYVELKACRKCHTFGCVWMAMTVKLLILAAAFVENFAMNGSLMNTSSGSG